MRNSLRPPALFILFCSIASIGLAAASDVAFANRIRPTMTLVGEQAQALPPLHLASHIVKADIHGRVARVTAESIYHNDTAQQLEATYVFPLPEGAAVDKFVMWMNGEPVEAIVAEKETARRTYESIVHRRKDPGLLEQIAENTFRYRIFPILAGSDQKIRIEYSFVLPLTDNGTVVHFDCPLAAPDKRDATPMVAKNFVVALNIEMDAPIAAITSASHQISQHIQEGDPRRARASIEELHSSLDRDFGLNIKLQGRAAPVTGLAYRQPTASQEGTLMLLITPELIESQEPASKDIVMVMDVSGSMDGVKIEQARAALRACINHLNTGDRFAIIAFSDDVSVFGNEWCDVTPVAIDSATKFVNALRAGGATNIEGAIRRALAYKGKPGRMRQILFATDGEPTIGEGDTEKLAQLAADKNAADAAQVPTRFFTFGIGYDVNAVLLDKIAALTHGDRAYVRPEEDIARKVGDLCDKIAAPVLTDATLTFSSNLTVQHIYPPQLGDLYLGRQVAITATYTAPGSGSVTIKGKRGGRDVAIEAPLTLPESTPAATSFLPKQWAIRKVGFLLDQMRLHGDNAELKNEVIRLGTLHGIVTPYTSYLALEAQDARNFQAQQQAEQAERARRQAQLDAQVQRSVAMASQARSAPAPVQSPVPPAPPAVRAAPTQPASSSPAKTPSREPRETPNVLNSEHDVTPSDPMSHESSNLVVPPDIMAKSELGDHLETINPNTHSASDVDTQSFHTVNGRDDAPGGGGSDGMSIDDLIGVSGVASSGTGGGFGGGEGTGVGIGTGAGHGSFGYRNGGGRRLMAKRFGGSAETEQAVELALRWLAYHQEPDGHFDGAKFGGEQSNTTVTSLALLSFLGAGHTEKVGAYKQNVQLAVKWLSDHQAKDGEHAGQIGDTGALIDQHLLATLALAEAAGMANIAQTRLAAQRAVNFVTLDQFADIARLMSTAGGDHAASLAWCVMALKSAKVAGLNVSTELFAAALNKLGELQQQNGTVTRFVSKKGNTVADVHATAVGLLCLIWTGAKTEDLQDSVDALIKEGGVPDWSAANPAHWCFGTQIAFQVGGDAWKRWNEGLKKALIENQGKQGDDAGSWNNDGAEAAPFGRVGQTALCCLCLETYYRYQNFSNRYVPARAIPAEAPLPSVPAHGLSNTEMPAPLHAPTPAETGKAGVDYSEYIRQLQEGIDPAKK